MARQVTCPKRHKGFTAAQYLVHKSTHHRDEFRQKDPVDLPTSKLLPIEVPDDSDPDESNPDDSDEVMEDTFEATTQTTNHGLSTHDDPFSDFLPPDNPFSDDHATTSTNLLQHNTPFGNTSTFSPSPPSNDGMDMDMFPTHSDDSSMHGPAPSQPSPLIDEDLGFEDSGLDPTFGGYLSLSEQLKERFLTSYHGGGKYYWNRCIYNYLLLNINSRTVV